MITREVDIGGVVIGGGRRPAVQSMTNTDTADVAATSAQLARLKAAGCDIARLAVRDMKGVAACAAYIGKCGMPLVADIQFDHRLAVACADAGFAKVRYNPATLPRLDCMKSSRRARPTVAPYA